MAIKRGLASSALFLFILSCCFMGSCSAPPNNITQDQQLRDYQHLVSPSKIFKLGFFKVGNSENKYLGIWFYESPELAVWVANRDTPIVDSSGTLTIVDGKLTITHSGGRPIVVSSNQNTSNATAKLMDSGNFVLIDADSNMVLWESFDYPTHALLHGMKLGLNFKTGHNWSLTSWLTNDLPATGAFTLSVDPNATSQLRIWRRGDIYWTSQSWNNQSSDHLLTSDNFIYVSNENENYFIYSPKQSYPLTVPFIDSWGKIALYSWESLDHGGYSISTSELIGLCEDDSFDQIECVEQNCSSRATRYELKNASNVAVDIAYDKALDPSLGLSDCEAKCLNNCNCVAYASYFKNKTGCLFYDQSGEESMGPADADGGFYAYFLYWKWKENATTAYSPNATTDYAPNEAISPCPSLHIKKKRNNWWTVLIIAVAAALLMLHLGSMCYSQRRGLKITENEKNQDNRLILALGTNTTTSNKFSNANKLGKDRKKDHELQLFSFDIILAATDDFSSTNKLGQGGFGPVYKGKLFEGREIAVKRLSRSSGQGLEEFKNEIELIVKLQHMNLVGLLGYCIEGEEMMLIYEYMSNKSLDSFLFDPAKRGLLDWNRRFNIIEGIAQGILYLHKYSRLRVIHRDLKASNILLDDEMNPKISDFGMARIFGQNESEVNTNRIVGTYGYMSPEYAMEGIFSIKSDVFSFGVLLLEILSGRKNTSFYNLDCPLNLIGYVWELWIEGRGLEVIDPLLGDASPKHELLRFIHVGLLCVQQNAVDRPTMSDVSSMLSNETIPLPAPKQPAFSIFEADLHRGKTENCSLNDVTISVMKAR